MAFSLVMSARVRARGNGRPSIMRAVTLLVTAAGCSSGAPTNPTSPRTVPSAAQGGSVTGVVSSSLGGPLAGYGVSITQSNVIPFPGASKPDATTGPDGSYTISSVLPGDGFVFVAVPLAGYCSPPAGAAFRGPAAGGKVTVNITVSCTPDPWDY
jgi:hypothetical protein